MAALGTSPKCKESTYWLKVALVKSTTAKLPHSLRLPCLRRQSLAPFEVRCRCIHNAVSQLHLSQFRFSVTVWLVPAALESSDRDYQQEGSEGQLTSPDSELLYVIAHSTSHPRDMWIPSSEIKSLSSLYLCKVPRSRRDGRWLSIDKTGYRKHLETTLR